MLQAREVDGEPNAETLVEVAEVRGGFARYRLTPTTGKTHQLRVHLNTLGIPIVGDPLYPTVREVAPDDFTDPLRLLARSVEFTDPLTGLRRKLRERAVAGVAGLTGDVRPTDVFVLTDYLSVGPWTHARDRRYRHPRHRGDQP